jgi:hypothetical protein
MEGIKKGKYGWCIFYIYMCIKQINEPFSNCFKRGREWDEGERWCDQT